MFTRCLVRLGLGFVGVLTVGVISYTFVAGAENLLTRVTAVASGLAVIAATLSAFSTQRLVELQEDAKEPDVYAYFDPNTRYGLMQVFIKNAGGSTARDVYIQLYTPILNHKGEQMTFPTIPVLQPGETYAVFVNTNHNFFDVHANANFDGILTFKNASGRLHKKVLLLSAEHYRNSLTFIQEDVRTNYLMQKIPEKLDRIKSAIEKLRR